ncbi:hypothetical protein FisN_24Hh023 [Fistulifera solaris]|uniref:Uncharacterized protein n=1 Tax=Fistulifera solaris TaxID=1519565 RepID=A0A1Z5KIH2_FISSO|nr:hypothetical protein FisN_24Hh023 [Fistulifera solaris]|eukprot:GAX26104.1 hypothetical protein FisN_24Hh023 [Fistulifera solaris]
MWTKGIVNLLSGLLGTINPPAVVIPRSRDVLSRCQGDCLQFDCDEGLRCQVRQAGDPVPGCVLTDELLQSEYAFCVAVRGDTEEGDDDATEETLEPVEQGTDNPSDLPSDMPSDFPTSTPTPAPTRVATQAPTTAATSTSTSGSFTPSPTLPRTGFTAAPSVPQVVTPTALLGVCQGGCFSDTDCEPGLICYQRTTNRGVPYCVLFQEQTDRRDNYCIPDPNIPSDVQYGGVLATTGVAGQLTECQADCSTDLDCVGDLVCYQRAASDGAPGCSLDPNMLASDADICLKNPTSGRQDNIPTDTSVFALKLYWEEGFEWQFESFERLFCLNCFGNCEAGGQLSVTNCFDLPRMWTLTSQSTDGSALIKLKDYDLCMEWNETFVSPPAATYLQPCNETNNAQRFWPAEGGSFADDRFEISPRTRRGMCLTQEHHPMTNEVVYFDYCIRPQLSDTSLWNKYFPTQA